MIILYIYCCFMTLSILLIDTHALWLIIEVKYFVFYDMNISLYFFLKITTMNMSMNKKASMGLNIAFYMSKKQIWYFKITSYNIFPIFYGLIMPCKMLNIVYTVVICLWVRMSTILVSVSFATLHCLPYMYYSVLYKTCLFPHMMEA